MIKQMNHKQLLIGGVAAAVLVLGGGYALMANSGKKAALAYYDDFKERYFLEDVLSEGEVSYSAFSGNLTVADPEIRVAAAQTNGTQQFMRGLAGMMESVQGVSAGEGLAGWTKYQLSASREGAGAYLKADALKLAHDGDNKDGSIHIQLLGMQMANPFVATKGAEVVLVADVSDEIQPRAELAANGRATQSNFAWGTNMAVRQPVTGAFLVSSTGEFGTTVDVDFTLKRSSDGEGSMELVVTHRNDGSKVGEIVRKAEFQSLPELDDVETQLKGALSAMLVGALSPYGGQAVLAEAVSGFARKAKVQNYSLTYSGFEPLKAAYDSYLQQVPKAKFAAFCDEVGLSMWSSDFGAKGKDHSDSECAIAQKLVADGKFEEQYTFKEGKSLFAALFVSKAYQLETN
ncbi:MULTISPECIES: hypothetical protein [Pseudomonas]|uniref:hypothetical protein n=1 Tax=Pseudomonas TaxID=286 RepID=UPI0004051D24|nr:MULTISPECIES: hypothetical protein [Pseudomonas]MBK4988846.1 hypothetical protein [Pseudomonas sp. S36]